MKQPRRMSYFILLAMLVLGVLSVFAVARLKTEYSVMQFLPEHHPAIQMDKQVRDRFHLTDLPLFIGMIELGSKESGTWLQADRLSQLSEVTENLKKIDGIQTAVSLGNVEGATEKNGVIQVGSLAALTPPERLSDRVLKDPLLTPQLISTDERTVLVYLQLKSADVHLLAGFQPTVSKILQAQFPQSAVSMGGVPAIQTDLGLLLNRELGNFLLLTILACAVTLFFIFRTVSTVLIPLILTLFCNLMVFAMMSLAQIPFTILSATIPVLVFITVVSLSVHFLLRLDEESTHHGFHLEKSRHVGWDLIWKVHKAIWVPNLLGCLTSCVGFLTLLLGDVPLIRDYGVAVAAGVMISWLFTSIGLLPLVILFPKPVPRKWVHRPARWALWTVHNSKWVFTAILVFCVVLGFGSRHLDWTARLFDDLPSGQSSRVTTEKIDSNLGGVIPMEISIHSSVDSAWNDPEKIRKLDQLVLELRQTKGVGSVRSLPDFFHSLEHLEHPLFANSRQSIAETYFVYSMSDRNPLDHYLADQDHSARVDIQLHDLPSNEMQELVKDVQQKAQKLFPEDEVSVGGMGAIVHIINDELSTELIFGFWQALGLIAILLGFLFRSLRWSLVACLPNLVPPIVLLGYLSLTHTPIKPGVAIIFSIALGLAFNNTVYVLNRLRALKLRDGELPVAKAFYLEGNPCLVSTFIMLAGFSVFLFSYFSLNQTFGACMIISILGGLLGDLIFLPAFLTVFPVVLRPFRTHASANSALIHTR